MHTRARVNSLPKVGKTSLRELNFPFFPSNDLQVADRLRKCTKWWIEFADFSEFSDSSEIVKVIIKLHVTMDFWTLEKKSELWNIIIGTNFFFFNIL